MNSDIHPLLPGEPAPELTAPLADDGEWRLHDRTPRNFQLIVVYRGHHCGACRESLEEWNGMADRLSALGVEALFISADDEARARQSREEWDIGRLTLACGWDIRQARGWGLYVSHAIKPEEPDEFLEPAVFILDPDFMVYSVCVQSNQFARPKPADVVSALEFIIEQDYPPRGTVAFIEDHEAELAVDLDKAPGG